MFVYLPLFIPHRRLKPAASFCHCEERRDEAISSFLAPSAHVALGYTSGSRPFFLNY